MDGPGTGACETEKCYQDGWQDVYITFNLHNLDTSATVTPLRLDGETEAEHWIDSLIWERWEHEEEDTRRKTKKKAALSACRERPPTACRRGVENLVCFQRLTDPGNVVWRHWRIRNGFNEEFSGAVDPGVVIGKFT